jgi:hypothetical protein
LVLGLLTRQPGPIISPRTAIRHWFSIDSAAAATLKAKGATRQAANKAGEVLNDEIIVSPVDRNERIFSLGLNIVATSDIEHSYQMLVDARVTILKFFMSGWQHDTSCYKIRSGRRTGQVCSDHRRQRHRMADHDPGGAKSTTR